MTLHRSPARSRRLPFRWAPWPQVTRKQPMTIREPESGWWEHMESERSAGDFPSVTVAVLGESETRWGVGAVVARLADLAINDELLIVYGTERRFRPGDCPVVSRLREQLPRHHVIAVPIARYRRTLGLQDAALVDHFLENGSLPVVVTPAPAVHDVAAELASRLRADRVVRVSWTLDGVDVCQVWHRTAPTYDWTSADSVVTRAFG